MSQHEPTTPQELALADEEFMAGARDRIAEHTAKQIRMREQHERDRQTRIAQRHAKRNHKSTE